MTRLVDCSHTIHDGLVTYPGLPAPRVTEHLSFEASAAHDGDRTEFQIGRIDMIAPRSSAPTRSTSTPSRTRPGRRTRCCWRR